MYKDKVRKYTKMKDGSVFVQTWDTDTYVARSFISLIFHFFVIAFLFVVRIVWWIIRAPFIVCKTLGSSWSEGKPKGIRLLMNFLAILVTLALVIVVFLALFFLFRYFTIRF